MIRYTVADPCVDFKLTKFISLHKLTALTRQCLQALRKIIVADDSMVLPLCIMALKGRLALLNRLVYNLYVSSNEFQLVKAHRFLPYACSPLEADSQTNVR